MGHIREKKLKKGGVRFQAEIRLRGHPTLTASFDRKTDAKDWIRNTEADIRCGRYQVYAESTKHTFKEAVEKYTKEQTITVPKKGHLEWWQKELGSLYLQDVRPSILSEKKQKLLSEPNKKGVIRTKSTCNRYLATLSHLMGIACKQWEWVSENPVRKISREKEPRERTRFLTTEERVAFLEACKRSSNPYLFTFVTLLLGSGCRYNEVRWLRWTDLDLSQGKMTISKTKNGEIHTAWIRGLPLRLLRDLAAQSMSLGYVFPGKKQSQPIEFRRSIRTAIKKSGLRGFRPHDCRHDFSTAMLGQGISLGEIGRLLNHKSVATTRRYSHLVESRAISALEKMTQQAFEGVENG